MKPIPAIDESGEFVEVELVTGIRVVVMALGEDHAHALDGNYVWRVSPETFKDWPAVRDRVERARLNRIYAKAPFRDAPKRPSFAEALESELIAEVKGASNYEQKIAIDYASCIVKRARAASGE